MPPPDRRFVVRAGDVDVVAERLGDDRVRVGSDATEFTVERCGVDEYLVHDGHRTWRVTVAGPRESPSVHVDGFTATLEVTAGRAPARPRSHDLAAVAPMPATVLAILVTSGQAVNAGDVLLTLEAMKMEMPVRAPRAGTVVGIRCAEGDLVQPGIVLVEIL